MTLFESLQALNKAAYDVVRCSLDQSQNIPQGVRARAVAIARETDKLVDENAPGISEAKP